MHRLADPQAGGVLVDLDRDPLALEADDLAGQRRLADAHDVVQAHALEAAGDHHRAGHAPDLAARAGRHCPAAFLTESDLVADGLAEHLKQLLAAILGLLDRRPGGKRHHERPVESVEPRRSGRSSAWK